MMKEEPLVYIVIVNFNNYKDTIECVKSIEKIEYTNIKIVIVDNNSNNNSAIILKEMLNKNITIIRSNKNLGFSGGNNIGIKYSLSKSADYILLINNDTIVEKNFLIPLIRTAKAKDNVGIISGQIYYYSKPNILWYDGGILNKYKGQAYHKNINKKNNPKLKIIEEQQFITGCFMFIPREIFYEVGLLPEYYFLYYEDTDFCMKVRSKGYKLYLNRRSRIYHKISKSTKKNLNTYFYYNIRNRLIFINNNFDIFHKIISYLYVFISFLYKYCKYRNKYIILGIKDFLSDNKGKLKEG